MQQALARLLDEFEDHFGTQGDVGLIEVRCWLETRHVHWSPVPPVAPDERERLHNLLQDFWSVTSPEQFPDLCEQAYQELKDCHGGCRPPEGSDAHDHGGTARRD